jgi:hypothetical protein
VLGEIPGRFASLVLVLALACIVSACASSGGAAAGGDGETAVATGGSTTLIVRAQLEQYAGRSALDAIQQFNRRWLRLERGGGGGAYARVVIDGGVGYDLSVLNEVGTNDIESMRYLDFNAATRKYGADYRGGVIEITSRDR